MQHELDRRVFHLKTLYDVSKDIFGSVVSETILRNFLLMTMGNFGAIEGFVAMLDAPSWEVIQFVNFGHDETGSARLRDTSMRVLMEGCALTGKDDKGFEKDRRRLQLTTSAQRDCAGLDAALPALERAERAAQPRDLSRAQQALFEARKRYRKLGC